MREDTSVSSAVEWRRVGLAGLRRHDDVDGDVDGDVDEDVVGRMI